ncbi:Transmembrane transcriptional regulator (anti-sigma factor RsiW) [Rhodovulum sp. ES.010]|uniref:anti-sigma factor family protein n=1 Tax=Rhodovulum sp. ES.010 TaxID=1882821 RepID=UPI000926C5F8|nr:anti-sigma factor [Rhodovulum sp. ES.010]SIO54751.1 Transmembrane transcriptional regulator (anti-sigma factor RsiW) [Rhodovulum sp. ES.010]
MNTDQDIHSEAELALDPELHAFVDGKLSPERMAAVEARLVGNAADRDAVAGWARDRDLIREAAAAADDRPSDMRTELLGRELERRIRTARLRGFVMRPALRQVAASVAIFVAGWGGHALYVSDGGPSAAGQPGFVTQAAMLHTVYDQRGIEEFDVSEDRMQASLAWLSDQMQRKIESPRLEELGLRVIGGRLVEGENGPLAQFTYEEIDGGGQITVAMSPHPESQPFYPYAVQSVSGRSVAYWTSDGMDFAVIGESEPARLATLAGAIR